MNNTRPTRWNSKIGKEMLICSKDEMAEIRRGAIKPDQLVVNKNNKFIFTKKNTERKALDLFDIFIIIM